MSNLGRGARAIQELKNVFRRTDSPNTVSNNIAVLYRIEGDFRRAFQWWKRTAAYNDGNAWLKIGYCLQYGIGTRRDVAAGIRAYRRAIKAYYTSEYAQEEAQYHLAVALLDRDKTRHHREVERLLRLAAEDGDYPQASDLIAQMDSDSSLRVCRCRRELRRALGGKAQCELHCGAQRRPIRRSSK